MDREIWNRIVRSVKAAARRVKPSVRCPRFGDRLIVTMYLWAVWHDRPQCWACDKSHYGALFRPRKLPSVSQFNRRIKTDSCQQILQRVHNHQADLDRPVAVNYIDGKPLLVSPVSKDRDARAGHVTGGFARGYKLHAWATEDGRLPIWCVTALNVGESPVARLLCEHLPPQLDEALALADGNYDAADLHKSVQRRGPRLLVPLRGAAEHPVTLRQMGAARRQAIQVSRQHPDLLRFVLHQRTDIERIFSALSCWGGGLGPLPAWVRTLPRVRRWVGAKIILYHARLQARKLAAA
jgi:hypothetical protein